MSQFEDSLWGQLYSYSQNSQENSPSIFQNSPRRTPKRYVVTKSRKHKTKKLEKEKEKTQKNDFSHGNSNKRFRPKTINSSNYSEIILRLDKIDKRSRNIENLLRSQSEDFSNFQVQLNDLTSRVKKQGKTLDTIKIRNNRNFKEVEKKFSENKIALDRLIVNSNGLLKNEYSSNRQRIKNEMEKVLNEVDIDDDSDLEEIDLNMLDF